MGELWHPDPPNVWTAEKMNPALLSLQRSGSSLAAELREQSDLVALYTIVFELLEFDDGRDFKAPQVKLELLPSNIMPPNTVAMYEYAKLCPSDLEGTGVSLFLSLRAASFKRLVRKEYNTLLYSPFFGHAVHILPPPSRRSKCISLPAELLRMIFVENAPRYIPFGPRLTTWRKHVVPLAMVCHSWEQAALEYIYEDFSCSLRGMVPIEHGIRIVDVVHSLRSNPTLGPMIRKFNANLFCDVRQTQLRDTEVAKALVEVLKHSSNIRDLYIPNATGDETANLLDAICISEDLEDLTVRIVMHNWKEENDPHFRAPMDLGELAKVLHNVPTLRNISIWPFKCSEDSIDSLQVPSCTLETLWLEDGPLSLQNLQFISSSSISSLRTVVLREITGITNNQLLEFLSTISKIVKYLDLGKSTFPKMDPDEPFAIDAILPSMKRLEHLRVSSGMFTTEIFERFNPSTTEPRPQEPVRGFGPFGRRYPSGLRQLRTRGLWRFPHQWGIMKRYTLVLDRNGGQLIPLNVLADMLLVTRWEKIELEAVGDLYHQDKLMENKVEKIAHDKGIDVSIW